MRTTQRSREAERDGTAELSAKRAEANQLTEQEKKELKRHEAIIQKGYHSMLQAGQALKAIRDGKPTHRDVKKAREQLNLAKPAPDRKGSKPEPKDQAD